MMKNQLAGLMKQAQQMQENMKKAQEELAQTEVEGQAGAGLVKVVMTCRHDVKRVSIDPSLVADDRDMLEDLVAAAVNDAVRRVESTTHRRLGSRREDAHSAQTVSSVNVLQRSQLRILSAAWVSATPRARAPARRGLTPGPA